MARKRQRAKDRKQKLHRENIPGSLDHASGEVEEVEAAIVAGARGTPVEPLPDDLAVEPVDAVEPDDAFEPDDEVGEPADVVDDEPVEALEPIQDVELVLDDDEPVEDGRDFDDEPAADNADAATVERGRLGKGAGDVAVTPDAHRPVGFRVTNFVRACWAELQRVDWPDRRQVGQATAVVLGFVVVAGAFLGLADVVAQRLVDLIL
jgi:preprotein translocase SecE subunit